MKIKIPAEHKQGRDGKVLKFDHNKIYLALSSTDGHNKNRNGKGLYRSSTLISVAFITTLLLADLRRG